jgi:hypothetical protein
MTSRYEYETSLPNYEHPVEERIMNVYEIDDGEQWWFAAESKDEALRLYLEPLVPEGTDLSDLSKVLVDHLLDCPVDEIEVNEVPLETELSVTQDDGVTVIKKTAFEWAADGAGLIAATVW